MKNQKFKSRFGYAAHGILIAWREYSFRTQIAFAILAIGSLPLLRPDLIWWALVGVMVALVISAELINTALEQLCDHLHPERHENIRIVKDVAAGAVLVLSFGALWVAALMVLSVIN